MLSVSEQLDGEEMWLFTELGMSQELGGWIAVRRAQWNLGSSSLWASFSPPAA